MRGLIPSEVQWLLDVAQTDKDGLIDLYTEPSLWWSLLEETDKVKLSKICGAAVLTEECASQLALGAARQMKEQVATARLYSEYTEPEGPKGPLNPDGLPGSDGLIELFRIENSLQRGSREGGLGNCGSSES